MISNEPSLRIAILGASGLIGQTVAEALARDGFGILAIARRFTPARAAAFGTAAVEVPIVDIEGQGLTYMLGAALLAPSLWIDPLGALVKTGPAIILMAIVLGMLAER